MLVLAANSYVCGKQRLNQIQVSHDLTSEAVIVSTALLAITNMHHRISEKIVQIILPFIHHQSFD